MDYVGTEREKEGDEEVETDPEPHRPRAEPSRCDGVARGPDRPTACTTAGEGIRHRGRRAALPEGPGSKSRLVPGYCPIAFKSRARSRRGDSNRPRDGRSPPPSRGIGRSDPARRLAIPASQSSRMTPAAATQRRGMTSHPRTRLVRRDSFFNFLADRQTDSVGCSFEQRNAQILLFPETCSVLLE
jgi:hypothetical protein